MLSSYVFMLKLENNKVLVNNLECNNSELLYCLLKDLAELGNYELKRIE